MATIFGALWVPCLILSILGLAFLIAELFLPGFGVSGVCGVICLLVVCVMQFATNSFGVALIVTLVLTAILVTMVIFFMRSMKNGLLFRSPIVLKDKIEAEAGAPAAGAYDHLVGKTGVALTPLRPSGTVLIEGQRYSVVTQATFVEKDSTVTVLSVDGSKITVQ